MNQSSSVSDEKIIVVDGEDQFLKTATRGSMRDQGLLHRVTYLFVFNAKNQILV